MKYEKRMSKYVNENNLMTVIYPHATNTQSVLKEGFTMCHIVRKENLRDQSPDLRKGGSDILAE